MPKSILFLVPYPHGEAPSQRFRYEQYLDLLKEKGYKFEVKAFYSKETWKILHFEGNTLAKIFRVLASFFVRFSHVLKARKYDVVFIHREVAPIGPPFFEWILAKVLKKKIVYDFDDAIWLPNFSEANTKFQRLKYYKKVNKIMKWANLISVGNEHLAEYARQFNSNIRINPTTIDTENYHNPKLFQKQENTVPVIGWTGSHTTMKYLDFLFPILAKLSAEYKFEFHVISNEAPSQTADFLHYIKWNKATEIQDLMRFDIGVMPLEDDQWSRGKCGFKALQYLSLGIPAIVSPVGVNLQIVDSGSNGFIAETSEEWEKSLRFYLNNPLEVKNQQEAARKKIVGSYSVESNWENFEGIVQGGNS